MFSTMQWTMMGSKPSEPAKPVENDKIMELQEM